MKLRGKRLIILGIGITLFLATFGAAFAAITVIQVSQTKPTTLTLSVTTAIEDDNIALWHDKDKTEPVKSVLIEASQTQPPLRQVGANKRPVIWIENTSEYNLRPVDPSGGFPRGENCCILHINAELRNGDGDNRGWTSEDPARVSDDWMMAPGELWQMELHPCCWDKKLTNGEYSLELVFGAIGESPDSNSNLPLSIRGFEAISSAEEPGQRPDR